MIIYKSDIKNFIYSEFESAKKYFEIDRNKTLIPFLNHELKIEDGAIFGDFFDIIIKNWPKYENVFDSHLGHCSLKDFAKEWRKKFKLEEDDEVEYLEVCWSSIEINNSEEFIEFYTHFHGVGFDKKENIKQNYALEYSPINELKKYPIKLNYNVDIFKNNYKKKIYNNIIINTKHKFTVYDVLSAIFFEISWCGTPKDRDKQKQEILNSAKDIKNNL